MKTRSKKDHTQKPTLSTEVLLAKAAAVEKLAAAAKKQLRLVKAEHKAAKKAFKQALGSLLRQKQIHLTDDGIALATKRRGGQGDR